MAVTFQFTRLEPFGVEVHADLSAPLAPSLAYHFRQLWREHGFVLARAQSLTMERQRELCALLGPVLQRAGEGEALSNEAGGPSASALNWHSDAAYTDAPFDAISLHARDVVDDASSTRFIDAARALADLPGSLQARLRGCMQEMISPHFSRLDAMTCDDPAPQAMKRGMRPAVLDNPHNGKSCLWLSALQTWRIAGMDEGESRAMIRAVFASAYAPEKVLEHRWRKGDVAFWDNIALQHARGDVGAVGRRVLQRVIVGTGGVAPHIAEPQSASIGG